MKPAESIDTLLATFREEDATVISYYRLQLDVRKLQWRFALSAPTANNLERKKNIYQVQVKSIISQVNIQ